MAGLVLEPVGANVDTTSKTVSGWAGRTAISPQEWLAGLGDGRRKRPSEAEVRFWRAWLEDGWTDYGVQVHPKTLEVLAKDTGTPKGTVRKYLAGAKRTGRLAERARVPLPGAPRSTPLYRLTRSATPPPSLELRDALGGLARVDVSTVSTGWRCGIAEPPEWSMTAAWSGNVETTCKTVSVLTADECPDDFTALEVAPTYEVMIDPTVAARYGLRRAGAPHPVPRSAHPGVMVTAEELEEYRARLPELALHGLDLAETYWCMVFDLADEARRARARRTSPTTTSRRARGSLLAPPIQTCPERVD